MAKFLMEHDRPKRIICGAGAAVTPDFWEMNNDGKSDLKGWKSRQDGWQELEIGEKGFEANKQAADGCPVNVIYLKNKKTQEKII